MSEFCAFGRSSDGISIRIEAPSTGAARRLLIDASYGMRSLEDIDNSNVPSGDLAEVVESDDAAPQVAATTDPPPAAPAALATISADSSPPATAVAVGN